MYSKSNEILSYDYYDTTTYYIIKNQMCTSLWCKVVIISIDLLPWVSICNANLSTHITTVSSFISNNQKKILSFISQ